MHCIRVLAGRIVTDPLSQQRGHLVEAVCVGMTGAPTLMGALRDAAKRFVTHPEMLESIGEAEYQAYLQTRYLSHDR